MKKNLKKTVKQVAKKWIKTNLKWIKSNPRKERSTSNLSTWYSKLNVILSILKNNFHLISIDSKLSKSLKQKPAVSFRKKSRLLSGCLLKKDIANQLLHSSVSPCRKCKLCSQVYTAKLINNGKLKIT